MAFLYITYLGIENLLRHYHIQNIEDRLYDLIPDTNDNKHRGAFLHWNAFSTPILTKNVKHITSSHTALSFFSYSGAVCAIILFSMGLVVSLFLEINPIGWFDKLILCFILILMVFVAALFWRLTINAKNVAQYSWDTAHENQQIRLKNASKELYGNAKSFRHLLKYLLYPKSQDPQKPMLIVAGFAYYVIYSQTNIGIVNILQLLLTMVIFDFLAYQARYQINDIRGIKEDKEAGLSNRLLSEHCNNENHYIKISLFVAIFRIILAFILIFLFGNEQTGLLLASLGVLFISTILYELARAKNKTYLIFVTVGFGYPLRFLLGFFAAAPHDVHHGLSFPFICFCLSLCAYGSFVSILSWTNEITDRIQKRFEKNKEDLFQASYEKKHYLYLQEIIRDRISLAESHPIKGKLLPLRERCKVTDPWNILFFLSTTFLAMAAFSMGLPKNCLIAEISVLALAIPCIYFKNKTKLMFYLTSFLMIITLSLSEIRNAACVLLLATQAVISATYFLLCYRPQLQKVDFKEAFKKFTKITQQKILGDYAVHILEEDKKKDKTPD